MTSFQTNSPSNLPKNHLPLQSLLRNLSRSQRKERLEKTIRNSNSGSPSETLTLFISDSKTKAIKYTTIMVFNKTMDTNSISTQVYKASVTSVETHTKLDLKPEKKIGLQTSELLSDQLNLEQPSTIKLPSLATRLPLALLMLSK